jgi:hypothetical protein
VDKYWSEEIRALYILESSIIREIFRGFAQGAVFIIIISNPLLSLTGLSLEINIFPEKCVIDYFRIPATNFLIIGVVGKILAWSGFLAHV